MKRTIWITRQSAFSIQCGGLDRLQVWFTCPNYYEPYYFNEIDEPFGSEREYGCFAKQGWQVHEGKTQASVSFGGLFGYESEISDFVWNKLKEHFGNSDFRTWEEYEKNNIECHTKNFMLKINLNMEMIYD